jgi:hypothetical protein
MSATDAAFGSGISRADLVRNTRKTCLVALRVAPWVMFGPITGFMTERAVRCYRDGHTILAGLYVTLNVMTLVAIPTLTAYVGAHIHG